MTQCKKELVRMFTWVNVLYVCIYTIPHWLADTNTHTTQTHRAQLILPKLRRKKSYSIKCVCVCVYVCDCMCGANTHTQTYL